MINSGRQALKLLITLIGFELLLVLVYAIDSWIQTSGRDFHDLFDLNGEGNLPAWFSSFQLLLIAVSFWVLAAHRRATHRPSRAFLRACGAFFLVLSIDETAMLHERITHLVGSRYVDWVPAYIRSHIVETAVCALILAGCAVFAYSHLSGLWRMSARAIRFLVAGCAVYLIGAAALETVGYYLLCTDHTTFACLAEIATEEFFEMLGASLILYAVLLLCCARKKNRVGSQLQGFTG